MLQTFDLKPDIDLDLMAPNQKLEEFFAKALIATGNAIRVQRPDLLLVQGDTATTVAAALAAFYNKTPVGHVQAGLRSGNLMSPWPEELNRRVTTIATRFHFAPTKGAREKLLAEDVDDDSIFVVGNTVVDALLQTQKTLHGQSAKLKQFQTKFAILNDELPVILVTGHRRESFGEGFENICLALRQIADSGKAQIVYPVHLNPNVRQPVNRILGNHPSIHLVEPQSYEAFIYLMGKAYIIVTDSGGIQEEAPSLGKPVVVMRDTTERPEAADAGTAIIAGTQTQSIVWNVERLLTDKQLYNSMAGTEKPYGDGSASTQIRLIIEQNL